MRRSPTVTVRVLGQYKADRDVAALQRLATEVPHGWQLEIVGRGWNPVPGWHTHNRFALERELADLITSSSVVVIPYRRFFQSGVAVRCLELGVPIAGPRQSSLGALVGEDCSWLVSGDDWLTAIMSAVATEPAAVCQVAEAAYHRAELGWRAWVATIG
jgi:hypothetical protein